MITPAVKHIIVKKRTATFKRHQSNHFLRVGVSKSKKPKSIGCNMSRRLKGQAPMPPPELRFCQKGPRHLLSNGFRKFVVSDVLSLILFQSSNQSNLLYNQCLTKM
ncbi:hypothetical protein BD560DRAFT_319583 [Blakeslea trispora]|nr:hypothetical protein BD560DRAFT_319583 [Blakeslea trispora]